MGYFRTWLEGSESRQVNSVEEAQALSQATGLDTAGIEFDKIESALAQHTPVVYNGSFPLMSISRGTRGNIPRVLNMMGALAQKMGIDPPKTLEEARSLKIRGEEFKKMTPPIIIDQSGEVIDGRSRVTAAKLLRVGELRAFVIG